MTPLMRFASAVAVTILTALFAIATVATSSAGARDTLTSFLTPSGNIACLISSTDGARCDIRQHAFHDRRPRSCHLDYDDSVAVDARGPGHLLCHGDTVFGSYPTLAYGRSLTLGAYRCSSSMRGVDCTNRRTQHGFFLSRADYGLF